jgi:hypothetical protein
MPATTLTVPTTTVPTARTSRAIDLAGRLVVAPALLIAPFAAIDRAAAACDPSSPVNNATVTCTGTTTNQNGTNGYGSLTDAGNTINVVSAASVTGTATGAGLLFQVGKVNNFGTITGGATGAGIQASNATVTTSGTITGGVNRAGIQATNATVTNSGTITAGTGTGAPAYSPSTPPR